jgi:hypothetical protein
VAKKKVETTPVITNSNHDAGGPMSSLVRRLLVFSLLAFSSLSGACAVGLTPEQKQVVAELRTGLTRIRQDVTEAQNDDARYGGGLIEFLIAIRLEVLRTNAALVEQRIHAIEGGVRPKVVVNTTKPDPERATELAREIETHKEKVAEARREADRYAGPGPTWRGARSTASSSKRG